MAYKYNSSKQFIWSPSQLMMFFGMNCPDKLSVTIKIIRKMQVSAFLVRPSNCTDGGLGYQGHSKYLLDVLGFFMPIFYH